MRACEASSLLAALVVALYLAPHPSFAKPLVDATPTPAVTPSPATTPAPIVSATPEPTPTMPPRQPTPEPAATPEVALLPAPLPTLLPTLLPTPLPTPYDYTGGMPGTPLGSRRVRAAGLLGVHVFNGKGWNAEKDPVLQDARPQSVDFVGLSGQVAAIYDLDSLVAAVGTIGGHTGSHTAKLDQPDQVITNFSLFRMEVAMRVQSPANRFGAYVQAGAGVHAGSKSVNRPGTADDDDFGRAGGIVHGALGGSIHLAPALDLIGELRLSKAPGKFNEGPDETALDLGGVSATVGASLRL